MGDVADEQTSLTALSVEQARCTASFTDHGVGGKDIPIKMGQLAKSQSLE
jgi:hypothetical protein